MIELISGSASETRAIAGAIAMSCRRGDIVVLAGPMGAGKTVFATGFAEGWGVDPADAVTSPTFTLVHTYESVRAPVHHADLYRLGSVAEVDDLGLREMADLGGVVIVEWGDVALERLGEVLVVTIETDPSNVSDRDDDRRLLTIEQSGHRWDARWSQLQSALARWVR